MIVFREVTKTYGGMTVLDRVSFQVDPGEFVFVTGPSGAGKSTIIHLLIRADQPTSGVIEVDGVDLMQVPASALQLFRRRTGVLFQDYKLLDDRTVAENVAFAMEVCGDSDEAIAARIPELLAQLGLTGREQMFPHQLSGGEKARTALARALVHKPAILIADEPTGNIDPRQSMDILNLLKQVHAEGVTVIVASHDQTLVDAMQTRVIRLEAGRVVRDAIGGYASGVARIETGTRKHKVFEAPVQEAASSETIAAGEQEVRKESEELHEQSVEPKVHTQHKKKESKGSGHVKPIAI